MFLVLQKETTHYKKKKGDYFWMNCLKKKKRQASKTFESEADGDLALYYETE